MFFKWSLLFLPIRESVSRKSVKNENECQEHKRALFKDWGVLKGLYIRGNFRVRLLFTLKGKAAVEAVSCSLIYGFNKSLF